MELSHSSRQDVLIAIMLLECWSSGNHNDSHIKCMGHLEPLLSNEKVGATNGNEWNVRTNSLRRPPQLSAKTTQ